MKKLKIAIGMTLILPLLLVACGGGSSDADTASGDPVDVYVGKWRGCLRNDVDAWQIVEITTTKINANAGTTVVIGGADSFQDAACTQQRGTGQPDTAQPQNFSVLASVNVQGRPGHRLLMTGASNIKFVFAVSGNQLFIGDSDGPSDTFGYPSTLINEPLIKQ